MHKLSLNNWKKIAKQVDKVSKSHQSLIGSLQKRKVPKSYYSAQSFQLDRAIINIRSVLEELMFDQLKDKYNHTMLLDVFYG